MSIKIRNIEPQETPHIYQMIRKLSEHEGLIHRLKVTEQSLHEALFSDIPSVFGLCASDGFYIVGFALMSLINNNFCYHNEKALYLEEFYIEPEYRRKKLGTQFFQKMAKIALSNDCNRMEWLAVEGNELASHFYQSLGCTRLSYAIPYRLPKEDLISLASLDDFSKL